MTIKHLGILLLLFKLDSSFSNSINKLNKFKYISSKHQNYHIINSLAKNKFVLDTLYFKEIFENAYSLYEEKPPIVWNNIFINLEKEINNYPSKNLSTKEYIDLFKKYFGPYLVGHFNIQYSYNGEKKFERIAIKKNAYIISNDCNRYKVFSKFNRHSSKKINVEDLSFSKVNVIFIDDHFIYDNFTIGKTIEYRKCLEKLTNSTPKNEQRNRVLTNKNWVYIKLASLNENELKPIISDRLIDKSKKRNIIFDLRDNYGGGLKIIESLFKKLGIYYFNPYSEIIINKNIYTTQLEINRYLKYKLDKTNRKNFKKLVNELDSKKSGKKIINSKIPFNKSSNFRKNILIVTNNYCSSACEGIVKILKQYKRTTIIGVNTSGSSLTEIGSPIVLPNSKIEVNFGYMLMVGMKKDPNYKELRGYLPDYWVELKSMGFKKLLKIANKIFETK